MPYQRVSDAGGLIAALATASGDKPYLGDPAVVDALLRHLAHAVTQRDGAVVEGRMTWDAAKAAHVEDCQRLARILTGQDPAYAAIPFNSPDQLGAYVKARLGVPDEDLTDAVANALVHFVLDILKGLRLAQEGNPDWETAIDGALEDYGRLFLGMEPEEEPD